MAYRVSSIGSVPNQDSFDFYIFLLGKSWNGGSMASVEKNFDKLGKNLSSGAIVQGYDDGAMRKELSEKMVGINLGTKDFIDFVGLGHSDGAALLITNKHPDYFSVAEDMAIYLPLSSIAEAYGEFDGFYSDLCQLVNFGDDRVIKKMQEVAEMRNKKWDFDEFIDIRPGAFGITFNLKKFIKSIINRFN